MASEDGNSTPASPTREHSDPSAKPAADAPKKRDIGRGVPNRQVHQRYFVRSYNHETDTYQLVWYDEAGSARELTARVPKTLQSAQGIHQRLQAAIEGIDGQNIALSSRMVIAEGGKSCTLLSVNPRLGRDDRQVQSEHGEYEWTPGLQRAIELDLDYALQQAAVDFHKSLAAPADAEERAKNEKTLHSMAVSEFSRQAVAAGASPEDVSAYVERHTKERRCYAEILGGKESLGSVRYDQRYDFASQNGHVLGKTRDDQFSALFNFCYQKALHDSCVFAMKGVMSQRESDLFKGKFLEGINPLFKAEDREAMSVEAGRLIASQTQLGLQDLCQIQPANPKIDEIEWQRQDPNRSMHFYLQRCAGKELEDALSPGSKIDVYLRQGEAVLEEELKVTAAAVGSEQKKALPSQKKDEVKLKDTHNHQILSRGLQTTQELFDEM